MQRSLDEAAMSTASYDLGNHNAIVAVNASRLRASTPRKEVHLPDASIVSDGGSFEASVADAAASAVPPSVDAAADTAESKPVYAAPAAHNQAAIAETRLLRLLRLRSPVFTRKISARSSHPVVDGGVLLTSPSAQRTHMPWRSPNQSAIVSLGTQLDTPSVIHIKLDESPAPPVTPVRRPASSKLTFV